jgi:hypothetical protein
MCWFVILFLANPERGHQFAPISFLFFFFSKDLTEHIVWIRPIYNRIDSFFLLEFESYETKALECIFQHMYLKRLGHCISFIISTRPFVGKLYGRLKPIRSSTSTLIPDDHFINGWQETSSALLCSLLSALDEKEEERTDKEDRLTGEFEETHNGAVTLSDRYEKRFRWSGTRAMRHYITSVPPSLTIHYTVTSFSCANGTATKGYQILSKTFGKILNIGFVIHTNSAYHDNGINSKRLDVYRRWWCWKYAGDKIGENTYIHTADNIYPPVCVYSHGVALPSQCVCVCVDIFLYFGVEKKTREK